MAQELELCDYSKTQSLQGNEENRGNTEPSERRLLRIGIFALAVLCVIQATLNISLRLGWHSREDTDQFPFNDSIIADLCPADQSQQNVTQVCSCCNTLLRLLREYKAMETERDHLRDVVVQLNINRAKKDDFSSSGFGSGDELIDLEGN